MGGICGIPALQTCWAGFWVIKIPHLLSSLLFSEATVSAPSDMLAHVHLLFLASSSSTFSVISSLQSTLLSMWLRSLSRWLPCVSVFDRTSLSRRSSPLYLHAHMWSQFIFFDCKDVASHPSSLYSARLQLLVSALSLSEACEAVFSGVSLLFRSEIVKQTVNITPARPHGLFKNPLPTTNIARTWPELPCTCKLRKTNNKYYKKQQWLC